MGEVTMNTGDLVGVAILLVSAAAVAIIMDKKRKKEIQERYAND